MGLQQMPARIVQGDYDDLASIAQSFGQQANSVSTLTSTIERLVGQLEAGGWIGIGAQGFFAEMRDLVFPTMGKLKSALDDAGDATKQISNLFQEAEQEASRCFDGIDGNGQGASGGAFAGLDPNAEGVLGPIGKKGKTGVGVRVNLGTYADGVNNWELVQVGTKFQAADLVSQNESTCALYSPINLAIMNGKKITQAQADKVVGGILDDNSWRPDLWRDNDPNWGFDRDATIEVLDKMGVKYTTGDFPISNKYMDRIVPTAEAFLIKQVTAGHPVLVATETDDIFGGRNSGHAYNVVGVQKNPTSGRLDKVLVSTNWGGADEFYEVPGELFVKEWLRYRNWGDHGGSYIVMN
jgi:WXG100 family type VII secretion target